MNINPKEEVPAGTLIISERPFCYALRSRYRTEHCDYCFLRGELRKCSNCHYAYYCGKVCQKQGWSIHKFECARLKSIYPRIIPDAARMLARLINKLSKGGDIVKSYYAPNKFRMFKDLMSHYPNIKDDPKRIEHFESLSAVLNEFLGDSFIPNPVELMGIYGRMCINSFNICDEELKSLGTGIYLGASILDHSCNPNVVAIFKGALLNIRVTETLPNLNWNKISLSYIDTLQMPEVRQRDLLSTYYFLCQCDRCLNIEESKIMRAAACPNTNCNEPVEIKEITDNKLNCESCGAVVPDHFVQKYKEVTDFTEIHLQNMKLAYLDVCKVCLKQHEGVLHKLNIQHVRILDTAFESCIDFKQWEDAKKYGYQLISGYRKYLGNIHPLLGILYLKLAKILIYEEDLVEGKMYLEKACKVLKITHGETSTIFREEIIPLIRDTYVH